MSYWLFKVSSNSIYPDKPGRTYVFDNTHSIHVRPGDEFIYLDTGKKYSLTGTGCISTVTEIQPNVRELRNSKVRTIYTANIREMNWFSNPIELQLSTKAGRYNRNRLELPNDLNRAGWSTSIITIESSLFVRILDAAFEGEAPVANNLESISGYIPDSVSMVSKRIKISRWRTEILERHNYTCLVCGTRLSSVLEAAHIRSWAADPYQRANPANGVCLCSYCHEAYDAGDILIHTDGHLELMRDAYDDIALKHFKTLSQSARKQWLDGIDTSFLEERIHRFKSIKKGAH